MKVEGGIKLVELLVVVDGYGSSYASKNVHKNAFLTAEEIGSDLRLVTRKKHEKGETENENKKKDLNQERMMSLEIQNEGHQVQRSKQVRGQ